MIIVTDEAIFLLNFRDAGEGGLALYPGTRQMSRARQRPSERAPPCHTQGPVELAPGRCLRVARPRGPCCSPKVPERGIPSIDGRRASSGRGLGSVEGKPSSWKPERGGSAPCPCQTGRGGAEGCSPGAREPGNKDVLGDLDWQGNTAGD